MTATKEKRIGAFFYGSFIRPEVMARGGLRPQDVDAQVARLNGFDIHVSPHANLSQSDRHCVYGVLVQLTHDELDRLYSADGVGVFLPEAVVVETADGAVRPALCFIPPAPGDAPADPEYLDELIEAADGYGFPSWYVERLNGLRTPAPAH
jgi:hypothetical protein